MVKMKIKGSAISLTSYKKKQQNKSEREIQGKLINLNKQYILNPNYLNQLMGHIHILLLPV
jgi:hypothetical protein